MKRSIDSDTSNVPKKRGTSLPSSAEQLVLQQTSILARENLATLQVNELLQEVSAESVYNNKKIKSNLSSIVCLLKELTNVDNYNIDETWLETLHIDSSTTIDFKAPKAVQLIGSYDLQTATFPYINFDICCTIPDETFDQK